MTFSAICWPRCLCSHWQMAMAASCGDEEMLMGISPQPRAALLQGPSRVGCPSTHPPAPSKSC